MILMTGLDFRSSIRIVRLKALPDYRFSVVHCAVIDKLDQFSDVDAPINIALPDAQILYKTPDKDASEIAWDCRHAEYIMMPKEKLNKTLALFQRHHIPIHAVDIESEAMARALRKLCHIPQQYFAILYSDTTQTRLSISIFEDQRKIFFHQENLQDNSEAIITRAFKLFEIRFPDIQIPFEARYAVGEQAELSKWGVIPHLSQQLHFDSEHYQHLFQKENTQWLLACGLSLWEKKSSWNLLPWRQQETQQHKKALIKHTLKIILYSVMLVFLCHGVLLFFLHEQNKQQAILDKKIEKLQFEALTVNQIQREIHRLQSGITTLKQLSTHRQFPIKRLENLSDILPPGIFLNMLAVNAQKISMTGCAETEAQVRQFLSTLQPQARLENLSQNTSNLACPVDFAINTKSEPSS